MSRWSDNLRKFVIQAVDSVKPSSRYLDDKMDFNSYVDVLLLDHKDEKKSQYINGCVLAKNLADKRMPTLIRNPSILLLKGSLGFMRDFDGVGGSKDKEDIYTDITTVVQQEDLFVAILEEKIKMINPSVIITEKDISFKTLEVLRRNKIAAISNLSLPKMKYLARLTKTIIVPSANVLAKNFQLGKCQLFKVENPVARPKLQIASVQRPRSVSPAAAFSKQAGAAEIDHHKQLIFFEGCNPMLGSTIILSGPFREGGHSDQLPNFGRVSKDASDGVTGYVRMLKAELLLRKMLYIARNIILERELLMCLKVSPSAPLRTPTSPYLVTREIKNRSVLVLYKVIIRKGREGMYQKGEGKAANESIEGETPSGNASKQRRHGKKPGKLNGVFHPSSKQVDSDFSGIPQVITENMNSQMAGDQGQSDKQKIDENFIKNKYDSMCSLPSKTKFKFYNVSIENYVSGLKQLNPETAELIGESNKYQGHHYDQDETLGNFLVKLA